jgi:hypothetical protein
VASKNRKRHENRINKETEYWQGDDEDMEEPDSDLDCHLCRCCRCSLPTIVIHRCGCSGARLPYYSCCAFYFLRLDLFDALDLLLGVKTKTVVAASMSKTNFTSLGPLCCLPWTAFLFGNAMIPVGGLNSMYTERCVSSIVLVCIRPKLVQTFSGFLNIASAQARSLSSAIPDMRAISASTVVDIHALAS